MKLNASGSALLYSVYIGGSADEWGLAIALDSLGQAYVTGQTTSTNFPVVGGFQTTLGDPSGDAFITKINAAGNAFLYSTYLGGNGFDQGQGIAADPVHAGIAYVTGDTLSTNLLTKNGFQLTSGGNGEWTTVGAHLRFEHEGDPSVVAGSLPLTQRSMRHRRRQRIRDWPDRIVRLVHDLVSTVVLRHSADRSV